MVTWDSGVARRGKSQARWFETHTWKCHTSALLMFGCQDLSHGRLGRVAGLAAVLAALASVSMQEPGKKEG